VEAKPGKEAEVERLIRDSLSIVKENQELQPGLEFAWGHRHLASLMPFQTSQIVKRICQVKVVQL
jgi:hypothetical protein